MAKKLKKSKGLSRRSFVKATVAVCVGPTILPSSVFGANAPSNRITMGCIGLGGMGCNDMRSFLGNDDVQVIAVCDPVKGSREYGHWFTNGWKGDYLGREPARLIVNDHYSDRVRSGNYTGCDAYVDFRKILERDDIDAVTCVTPDHWHGVITVAAARSGKHIYCQKPLSLTINDGRAMVDAVRQNGVILQTGSHQRSERSVRFACELVQNGRIGKLKHISTGIGANNRTGPGAGWKPDPIPEGFDYEMWLGPAPWAPYHKKRCLYSFRFIQDYSGGQPTNLGAHVIDIAQWGNGTDRTGPVEVEDLGGTFPKDGLFNTADFVHFGIRYANGVTLTCKTGGDPVRFEGDEGWIIAGEGKFETHPESLKTSVIGANEIHLHESRNHHRNFLDSIKSGRDPVAPVEVGHRSATICHLGNIAMKLRRRLKWDPDAERFIGDDEANRMLSKPMRAPWHV
jgi:predicted dehydrogenase